MTLLKDAFLLYKKSFATLMPVYLLMIIASVLSVYLRFFLGNNQTAYLISDGTETLFSSILYVALLLVLVEIKNGKKENAFSLLLNKGWSVVDYFLTLIKVMILTVAGLCLVIIPGFFVIFFYYYAPAVSVIYENEQNVLKKSAAIVKSQLTHAILLFLVMITYGVTSEFILIPLFKDNFLFEMIFRALEIFPVSFYYIMTFCFLQKSQIVDPELPEIPSL